ncbi:hypothetical protein C7441_114132 [Pseudaminobacter salicylatoxidans]|uniref:Uncharacterized protein n=2 Tax=Pseudaminobacter salicylatoxidans TaxID=93369 RepID=A0A316C0T2_PSESE|nr:hypothetical protein C7441_114132 [Pseudaminobacter salicylatoxidans]
MALPTATIWLDSPARTPQRVLMTEEEPGIVVSPLSGEFTRDGITVVVIIYRALGGAGWLLEVVYDEDIATSWEDPFETDQEARDEFLRTVEREGINAFLDDESSTIH